MRNRVLRFLPIALTAAFISACADAPTTVNRPLPSGPSLTNVDDAVANNVEPEVLKVCKVWVNASDADIDVTVSGSTNDDGVYTVPTATGTPPNTCRAVAIEGALAGGGAGVNITVTEDDPGAGFSTTWTVDNSDNTLDAAGAGLSAATLIGGSGPKGAVITFTNTFTPPPTTGCTYTKGWYRNNGSSTVIAVDGRTVADAQAIFKATPGKPGLVTFDDNNTLLNLYQQLLAALNNLAGDPLGGPDDVDDAIADALAGTSGGPGVDITTTLTQEEMSDLIDTLSSFNEGEFDGWPHCDDN